MLNVDRELTQGRHPTPKAKPRKPCPWCRRQRILLCADGTLRSHRDGQGLQCNGSGRRP